MKDHPERMILIAVAAALVVAIIGTAVSCHVATEALGHTSFPSNDWLLDHNGDDDSPHGGDAGNTPGDAERPEDGSSSQGADDDTPLGGYDSYSEGDVPDTMDIDVAELTDDLQACINNDLMMRLGAFTAVEVTDLTKDTVAKPELKAGRVLGKAGGKATIEILGGGTATVDYTSYYYAADPTADTVTWYIYGYDLGSYDLFPEGFKDVAGDPVGIRDKVENGIPTSNSELGRDKEGSQQAA